MKNLHLFLTLCISIIIPQAYAQGFNNANSGQAAVEGFLKTSMAKYDISSKEMLSYMLPSFLASNPAEKVNMYTNMWQYNIEKSSGNLFYVAVFTEPDYKSMCKLITFETKQENSRWYLVPSDVEYYDVGYIHPWVTCSESSDYVPGTGPYEGKGELKDVINLQGVRQADAEKTTLSDWNFLDNTKSDHKVVCDGNDFSIKYMKKTVQVARDKFKDKLEIIHDKALPLSGEEFNIRLGPNQKLVVMVVKPKCVGDGGTFIINDGTINGVNISDGRPKVQLFRVEDQVKTLDNDLYETIILGTEGNEPVFTQINTVHRHPRKYSARNHVSHLRVKVSNVGTDTRILIAKGKIRMGPP